MTFKVKFLSRVPLFATPWTVAHQAPPSKGFSRQEHWSGLPFPSPMHESEKWKGSRSVMSDSLWPPGLQPTRLLRPWDFPGKSTGVGCHCLLRIKPLGNYKILKAMIQIAPWLKPTLLWILQVVCLIYKWSRNWWMYTEIHSAILFFHSAV